MSIALLETLYHQRFEALKSTARKAFIPFTLLGWPNLPTSKRILKTMIDAKPACLELGLPFSDPVADGPVIQQAVSTVLEQGVKISDCLELIAYARSLDAEIPIGLLVYYNTVLARGVDSFFRQVKQAGVNGVLIADLPPEAAEEIWPVAQEYGIALIFIVSPLTTPERLKTILTFAGGFLYVVSRLGITGTEERYDTKLQALLSQIKEQTRLPACVGFGISTPQQAKTMLNLGADGFITGSRLLQIVEETGDDFEPALLSYLKNMVAVTQA